MGARDFWEKHAPVANPGLVTPGMLWFLRRIVHPYVRVMHRATLDGIERLPTDRPYLLVLNHPSGYGGGEFPCVMSLYARAFAGTPPPLAAYVLAMSFRWFPLSLVFPRIGAIPSTYAAAEDALAKGVPIALCPGGLHEALKPFWTTDRADLGGHKGFLRIARKAWVPIVPMGVRGTSAPMLFQSRLLASLFVWPRVSGLNTFALSVLGVIGAVLIALFVPLPWFLRVLLATCWVASPLALFPWLPVRVRIQVGEPIAPELLFGAREDSDDAALDRALRVVESAITKALQPPAATP